MLVTDTLTGNTGITQNVKWGGGSFAVGFNNNRQEQSDLFATRNPALNTNLTAVYVQPLLRNFRIDGTRAQLRSRSSTRRSPRPRCGRRSCGRWPTCATRTGIYVFAIQAPKSPSGRWRWPRKLVEDNQARVEVGTLAPLDVVQAQAEEANAAPGGRHGSDAVRTAELALKRLIVNGTDDPLWRATHRADRSSDVLDPTPSTSTPPCAGRWPTRTDLEQSRQQLQSNDISLQEPVGSAAAGARPDRQLRAGRRRRPAVHSRQGLGSDDHADHSERLLATRCGILRGSRRADLERRGELQLSRSAPARPRRTLARARRAAAADDRRRRRRSSCRLPPKSPTPRCRSSPTASGCRPRRRRASSPRSGSTPSRAASTSACRPTSSSSRRSATCATRRTPSCARCSTTAARWSTSSACRRCRRTGGGGITAIQAGGGRRQPGERRRRRFRRQLGERSEERDSFSASWKNCHRCGDRRGRSRGRRSITGAGAAATRPRRLQAPSGGRPRRRRCRRRRRWWRRRLRRRRWRLPRRAVARAAR